MDAIQENEALRMDNQRLTWLIERAHNVVSELVDGSRAVNAERCGAWKVKQELADVVTAYYAKERGKPIVCPGCHQENGVHKLSCSIGG